MHCDWKTRTVPALVPDVAALVPVAVVEAPAAGEALEAPVAPAEALGEAAAEVRGVEVVEAAPLVPKLTAPTASWTLNGGGGTTPPRTEVVVPDEPVAPVLARGDALLLVAPVAPALALGAALLAAPVVPPVEEAPEVLPLAVHEALDVPAAPEVPAVPVAPGAVEAADDAPAEVEGTALTDGAVLAAADGAVLAAVLGAVAAPVLVLGEALPELPQAASRTKEAAVTVVKSGLGTMGVIPPR